MRIDVERAVPVPPARVMALYATPAFYENRPTRDDIAMREVVAHEDTGTQAVVEVRFAFTGSVSAAVRAVVDPARLSWVTRMVVIPGESRATWRVVPDHYEDRLTASGTYRFSPGPPPDTSTVVRVEGELRIHLPIVGRSVERTLATDLRRYIEDEVSSLPTFA
jgi:uncharacterized protein YndB with AHSA1/START domain